MQVDKSVQVNFPAKPFGLVFNERAKSAFNKYTKFDGTDIQDVKALAKRLVENDLSEKQ